MTQAKPSGRSRRLPALSIVLLVIAALLVVGGGLLRETAPDPEATPPAALQAPALQTFELRLEQLQSRAEFAGLLEAQRRVDLFAEEEGRVIEVGAAELERVEAGQLLLRIDPSLAQIAHARARAAVERATSQGVLALANLERHRGLAGRDVSSRAALDEAENEARQAAAAKIEAQAELDEAEDRLAKKTIVAPFSGVLRTFAVEEGEYVRPGERVAELLDVAGLHLTIGLAGQQVVAVTEGGGARLLVDARPGEFFEGVVTRVGGAIDTATRKFPVRIELSNASARLLPGMVARAELTLGEPRPALTLPRNAVLEEFGQKYAWVVSRPQGEDPLARKRRVRVRELAFRPSEFEVLDGLAAGELLVISSLRQLRDGMVIRPLPPSNIGSLSDSESGR